MALGPRLCRDTRNKEREAMSTIHSGEGDIQGGSGVLLEHEVAGHHADVEAVHTHGGNRHRAIANRRPGLARAVRVRVTLRTGRTDRDLSGG